MRIPVQFAKLGFAYKVYLDIGTGMSLIDRDFLYEAALEIAIKRHNLLVLVRGIRGVKVCTKYVDLDM